MTTSPAILIVEDEQVVAMDLEATLLELGYQVYRAHTGRAAIGQAQAHRPDLVLMDIRLQGALDGIGAAAEIRAQLDVPVVYLTAYSDDATRQRAGETTPYGYLVKPFDERTLQTTIEMALIRHAHDRQLQVSEEWYRTTLASIGDGVITTDAEGQVTYVNPAAADLLGIAPDEAQGRPITAVVPVQRINGNPPTMHPVHQALSSGARIVIEGDMLLQLGGRELWIADSVAPIRRGAEPPLGAVMVLRDATGRRQAERERWENQQRQEELRHLERLQVLSGGAAHDINNLLTGLLGYVELARMERESSASVSGALDQIETICYRAAELTQHLLAYAGRARLSAQPVDLNQVVLDVLSELGGRQLRDLSLELELHAGLPAVEGDAAQLHQVVLNLIVNAAEAVEPNSGRIVIRTALSSQPARAAAETLTGVALPPGPYVLLTVRDTGVGIDAATLAHIFEPFYTTKFLGRGLGLAAVLGNVRSHRGTIEVQSEPGSGSEFTVALPVRAGQVGEGQD